MLRVVGAGLGRTGTLSLKVALERLLGGACYHMAELFSHPEHVPLWHAAARGSMPDWHALFRGYRAAVDWPVASFWFPSGPGIRSRSWKPNVRERNSRAAATSSYRR